MRKLILAQSRNANLASKPAPNFERINQWIATLNAKAFSGESKLYTAQLSSLFNFYSKPNTTQPQSIDWDYWREEINTVGLVDKVHKGYTTLVSQEYDVERICHQVVSSQSKELEDLESELTYHSAVWSNYYIDQALALQEIQELGDTSSQKIHETYDQFPGYQADLEELVETHNWIPGSKDDINMMGFMSSQFSWGKKVISFYRHPADDFKAARATKNILGR
ncbi:hypothetical protein pb186bvf_019688 [Paramecium bursaria]